jgi:hypothetical protein
VAAVALALGGLLGACSDGDGAATTTTVPPDTALAEGATATTAPSGPPPGAELEGLRELEPGQCFDTVDDPVAGDKAVYVVTCPDPHTYEVYEVVAYEGEDAGRGADYPGTATVQNAAEQACFDRFEAFVGVRWTLSELDIQVWWPSEDSWARADRSIICAVVSASGDPLTGSRRGTAS